MSTKLEIKNLEDLNLKEVFYQPAEPENGILSGYSEMVGEISVTFNKDVSKASQDELIDSLKEYLDEELFSEDEIGEDPEFEVFDIEEKIVTYKIESTIRDKDPEEEEGDNN